jgi:CYTH domain-containing protein
LRKSGSAHSLTYKRGTGNAREEREITLTRRQFAALWPATNNRRLTKIRYDLPFGKHTVEIDVYQGRHKGLVVAEVEFKSEKEAAAFQRPDWLGKDVTRDPRYSNQLLAAE